MGASTKSIDMGIRVLEPLELVSSRFQLPPLKRSNPARGARARLITPLH